jgi:hypothetical protein
MKTSSRFTPALAFLILLVGSSHSVLAATIFLQFAGENAWGDIDGVPFSGADWQLEYEIDDTLPDRAPDHDERGSFASTSAGRIQINGDWMELDASQSSGFLRLWDRSKSTDPSSPDGDGLTIVFGYGKVEAHTADNGLFPTLFSDNNDLASANFGTVLAPAYDPRWPGSWSAYYGDVGGSTRIVFDSGPWNLHSVTVSDTSIVPRVIPEPSTLAIWGVLGGLGLIAVRRRRKQAA